MDQEQINRILTSCDFKYTQQKSNMKKRLINNEFKSILQNALYSEIQHLNKIINKQNMFLDILENKYRNK